jgi:putative transposase
MSIAVSSFRYRSRRSDELLRERLVRLAREKPRYGYRRLQVLVAREGERVNHKRLYRIYREAGLCLKRKKRKHCVRSGSPRTALRAANQEWALDFAQDVIAAGRTIRVLSVLDAYTRECLALEVDTGFARFALKLAHRDSSVFQRDTVWHGLKRLLKKPLCGA